MQFFVLRIKPQGERQFVFADDAQTEAVAVPFSDLLSIETDRKDLQKRGSDGFKYYNRQRPVCERVGELLFKAFFPLPVLTRYNRYREDALRRSLAPRIALDIPPELYYLPWELLRDPKDNRGHFLATLGSLVRCDSCANGRPLGTYNALKVLAVAPRPENLDPLHPFEPVLPRTVRVRRVVPATYEQFSKRVKAERDVDGYVFIGHGSIDHDSLDGILYFVRKENAWGRFKYVAHPVPSHSLGRLLGTSARLPDFMFVFACESAWGDNRIVFDQTVTGSLLSMTSLGVVIGAQANIDMTAAQRCFVVTLDRMSGKNPLPLDLALTAARNAILDTPVADDTRFAPLDWWVPALYIKQNVLDALQQDLTPRDTEVIEVTEPDIPAGLGISLSEANPPTALRQVVGHVAKDVQYLVAKR